jgi:hypothetical protein
MDHGLILSESMGVHPSQRPPLLFAVGRRIPARDGLGIAVEGMDEAQVLARWIAAAAA